MVRTGSRVVRTGNSAVRTGDDEARIGMRPLASGVGYLAETESLVPLEYGLDAPRVGEQKQRVVLKIFDPFRVRGDGQAVYVDVLIFDPAHMLIWQLFHADFHIVFVLQPVLQYFKLEDADDADDDLLHTGIEFLEDLNGAFERDLRDPLHKLLALHRIDLAHAREMLGRERRDAGVADVCSGCAQRVADGKDTGVENADDVSGIRLFYVFALLRHHLLRLGEPYLFSALDVHDFHARRELAGTDAHESDAVAVSLIHICLYLKYEGGEITGKRTDGRIP